MKVASEARVGSVWVDLLTMFDDGKRVAIQISCSKNFTYEAEALAKLEATDGVDGIWLVAASKEIGDGIRRAHDPLAHNSNCAVRWMLGTDFLGPIDKELESGKVNEKDESKD